MPAKGSGTVVKYPYDSCWVVLFEPLFFFERKWLFLWRFHLKAPGWKGFHFSFVAHRFKVDPFILFTHNLLFRAKYEERAFT